MTSTLWGTVYSIPRVSQSLVCSDVSCRDSTVVIRPGSFPDSRLPEGWVESHTVPSLILAYYCNTWWPLYLLRTVFQRRIGKYLSNTLIHTNTHQFWILINKHTGDPDSLNTFLSNVIVISLKTLNGLHSNFVQNFLLWAGVLTNKGFKQIQPGHNPNT